MTTRDGFERELKPLLREQKRGTVALFSDCLGAYWNGHTVVYVFLCEHGSGAADEEFDLDDYVWEEWQPNFERWLMSPVFTVRTEVLQWLKDSPPHEAGA